MLHAAHDFRAASSPNSVFKPSKTVHVVAVRVQSSASQFCCVWRLVKLFQQLLVSFGSFFGRLWLLHCAHQICADLSFKTVQKLWKFVHVATDSVRFSSNHFCCVCRQDKLFPAANPRRFIRFRLFFHRYLQLHYAHDFRADSSFLSVFESSKSAHAMTIAVHFSVYHFCVVCRLPKLFLQPLVRFSPSLD